MAIFSRRVLQGMLDANVRFLTESATARHVAGLNAGTPQSLDTEWEVVVLFALARLGTVVHEKPVKTGRKPDVYFRCSRGKFVGDIATVSDAGVTQRNPWPSFEREFLRCAREVGLSGAGFDVLVGARVEGSGRSRRVVLALPSAAQMRKSVEREFAAFLGEIGAAPRQVRQHRYHTELVDLTVTFDPARPHFASGYRSYDLPQSLTHNPLYLALKRKADQLRGLREPTVVFACDGGSVSLRSPRALVETVSTAQIIARFFSEHRIAAVCTLTVEDRPRRPLQLAQPPVLKSAVHFNPRQRTAPWLKDVLSALAEGIPAPERRAENALSYLAVPGRRHSGDSFWGGYTVTDNTIRLSARSVLELLAGKVSSEELQKAHGFIPWQGRRAVNPLAAFLSAGRSITGARIERVEEEDDDWLVLEFGDPDPAASPFRVPSPTTPLKL
jgi:hypothetical protein